MRWWQGVSGYCGGLLGTGQVNIVLVTIGLLWDILEIENRMSPNACIVHSTMYSTQYLAAHSTTHPESPRFRVGAKGRFSSKGLRFSDVG